MNPLSDFSLVPGDYKTKDPRQLAYLFPRSIMSSEQKFISYNKKMQTFLFYHSLEVAEHMAKLMDYILLPAGCIHWRRAKALGDKRRVPVGRNIFYLVKYQELNKNEINKLLNYADEIQKELKA
ncbi:hypothetical protein [Solibacillus sp. FSL K6-1523]|uniref:hypothetical protein n=1 Tax=Solibacillus sp. FSL K6-1523 TaxID=2921471 RepID=UPI0030FB383C